MKAKQSGIPRNPLKVPKSLSNPAAALIRDTIAHHGVTQVEAAEAMKISKAQLSDVIRQKKGVSANLALRVQFCFGIPGDLLIRLQAQFDFQKDQSPPDSLSKNRAMSQSGRWQDFMAFPIGSASTGQNGMGHASSNAVPPPLARAVASEVIAAMSAHPARAQKRFPWATFHC